MEKVHMDYKGYIKSSTWKERKEKKIKENKCSLCGTTKGLQAHHINYKRLGKEYVKDLTLLCGKCHLAVHTEAEKVYKYKTKGLRKIHNKRKQRGYKWNRVYNDFILQDKPTRIKNILNEIEKQDKIRAMRGNWERQAQAISRKKGWLHNGKRY